MKKFTSVFVVFIIMSFSLSAQTLSKDERNKALEIMKASQTELLNTIKGLSIDQLNFKPTADAWSIAECVEHIAISEKNIFGILEMTLQNEPDPSKRSEVTMSDEQVLGFITSREQKVKTRKEFEPTNNFGSYKETINSFSKNRMNNMKYVKETKDDLRNRYFEFPFGTVDSYQVVLFMSGHTIRHTNQIKEVMADASFPSK